MRKLFVYFVFALACMGFSFAHADEKSMTKAQKDQCLLISKDCQNEVTSIQQKIKKLEQEIKKGTRVYSADEMKTLKYKLKDAEETLDNMMKN